MPLRTYYPLIAIVAIAILLRSAAFVFLGNIYGNPVDIYYVDNEAAKLLLQFKDPYLYSNYANQYGAPTTLAYLPIIPMYFSPFVLVGLDIKWAGILADVVIIISLYFISKSVLEEKKRYSPSNHSKWTPPAGGLLYAILPIPIILTSITGSNQMIGIMFLTLALAALFKKQSSWLAGLFLGLSLAANQFIILLFPILAIYSLRLRDYKTIIISILIASVIILPFFFYSPANFVYDVGRFQFVRPIQHNGIWGLYGIVYWLTGYKLGTLVRIGIFGVPAAAATVVYSRGSKKNLLVGMGIVSAIAAVVLPIDGFWNYFLLPITMLCALTPLIITRITARKAGLATRAVVIEGTG